MNRRAFLTALAAVPLAAVLPKRPELAFHPDAFSLVSEPLLRAGDIIVIEGCYAFDPNTRQETNRLQEWVVTDDNWNLSPIWVER